LVAPEVRTLRVPPESRGERLDRYLAQACPDLSRSRLASLIDGGQVRVAGKPAKPSARLKGGEEVALAIPAPVPAVPQAEDLPLSVLYEDKDLVAIDKAAGMVVHPAAGNWQGTVVNALLHRVTDLAGVGGELRPGIVHRLDKETSGCLVVAKSERALAKLQASFKAREVKKVYLAVVHGQPKDEGRIETLYGRHPVNRKKFTGKVKAGKSALTLFRTVERFDGAALVEVDLQTGRTHQIRVHLAESGHPLLGDALYGGKRKLTPAVKAAEEALGRQALHAWKLAFPHPRTGKPVALEAPVPADLQRVLALLRGR
jgi:23S rRNA pseudouridine1911/1915/1917 synthase